MNFNGSETINEIDVFTLQDNYTNPGEPTEAMLFSQYGIVNFKVQFWNGTAWDAVSGGVVDDNNKCGGSSLSQTSLQGAAEQHGSLDIEVLL